MNTFKTFFIIILILVTEISVVAEGPNHFSEVIDFSITLKDLDSLIREEEYQSFTKKLLILDGKIRTIEFVDSSLETFTVIVELVKGEWIGLERISSYRSLIIFEGSEFTEIFNSNSNSIQIKPNSRVIIAAKINQPIELTPGIFVWLLKGIYIRKI